jgi:hypothetical protein
MKEDGSKTAIMPLTGISLMKDKIGRIAKKLSIPITNQYKYLGVIIDGELSADPSISRITGTI